jgi:hypothetical protein
MGWAGRLERREKIRNAIRTLVVNFERKRPLGTPRRRCEDNIKMKLREIRLEGID